MPKRRTKFKLSSIMTAKKNLFNNILEKITKTNIRTSLLKSTPSQHILKGGKLIGEGSFGCVIKPAIPCKHGFKYPIKSSVSKIIRDPDYDDIKEENKVTRIIKQIDPQYKFFIPNLDMCTLHNIPSRPDVETIEMIDNSYYYSLNNNKKDKHTCKVDIKTYPYNIIMPYGGKTLDDILKKPKKYPKHFSLFLKNMKYYLKHLLLGLKTLQENNIVNRDIKDSNIVCLLSKDKLKIRYIDFGLSLLITESLLNNDNIMLNGSPGYYPLDNIISFYIVSYYPDKNKIYSKIFNEIKEKNNYISKLIKLKLDHKLNNLNNDIDTIYNILTKKYENNTFYEHYYGYNDKFNGLLQKTDIYSLGITFYTILITRLEYDINKLPLLNELLYNMTLTDHIKRYNVLQCLDHPFFNSKEKILI